MDAFFYVMAIMGCGDAGAACAQARIEPIHYPSIQACQAAMPAALQRNTDLAFPVVAAACRASGARLVQADRPRNRG